MLGGIQIICLSSVTALKCCYLYLMFFLSCFAHLTFLNKKNQKLFVEIPAGFSLVTELKAGRKKNCSISKFTVLCIFKRTKN